MVIVRVVVVNVQSVGDTHIRPPNAFPLYKPPKRSVSSYDRFGTDVQQILRTYLCFVSLFVFIIYNSIICVLIYSVQV